MLRGGNCHVKIIKTFARGAKVFVYMDNRNKNKKSCTVVDLFSGCGGLSSGLAKVGFEVLLGVDNWEDALNTFQHNHPGAKTICKDITKVKSEEIEKIAGKKMILWLWRSQSPRWR